jgi:hypothetical protein
LTRISPTPPTPSAASRCERHDRPVLQPLSAGTV